MWLLLDLGRSRRNEDHQVRKRHRACRPYPGRLGSGVSLSGITGCSFHQQPALAHQTLKPQPQVFALKNPNLRTTERVRTSLDWSHFSPWVPTSLGWPHFPLNLPWLAPLSLLFPSNKPCSPQLTTSIQFLEWLQPNSYYPDTWLKWVAQNRNCSQLVKHIIICSG